MSLFDALSAIDYQEVLDVALFRAGFNSAIVLSGTTLLGISAGLIGTFSLLRKRALMGDALAHSALPGLALAYLFAVFFGDGTKSLALLLFGASITGILGVLTVQFLVRYTRLAEDAAIGAVLSVFFGFGVVLLSVVQNLDSGSAAGLSHFIYGQTAAMSQADARVLFLLAACACLSSVALFKEFSMLCFDTEYAQTQGWPVGFIDFLMMTQVVVVTVLGLQSVGIIMIVALLIIPASAARFWTERLSVMLAVSALIGGASGYFGALISSLFPHAPAGAVIVLTAGMFFLVSFLFAPQRGVVASIIRSTALHLRVAEEHLLRSCYEFLEGQERGSSRVQYADIDLIEGWSPLFRILFLLSLRMRGCLSENTSGYLRLSEKGELRAANLTRNHRLWEEYILQFGNVAVTHVDYSADLVEHVLSAKIIAGLEEDLERKGVRIDALQSPHPLGVGQSDAGGTL